MIAILLGTFIIGLALGLIPLIVSVIKHNIKLGLILLVVCGIAGVINILAAIAVAVIGSIIIVVMG